MGLLLKERRKGEGVGKGMGTEGGAEGKER